MKVELPQESLDYIKRVCCWSEELNPELSEYIENIEKAEAKDENKECFFCDIDIRTEEWDEGVCAGNHPHIYFCKKHNSKKCPLCEYLKKFDDTNRRLVYCKTCDITMGTTSKRYRKCVSNKHKFVEYGGN